MADHGHRCREHEVEITSDKDLAAGKRVYLCVGCNRQREERVRDPEEGTMHILFDRAKTVFKMVHGSDGHEFKLEGASRAGVEEYLELAREALGGMPGEEFDLKIKIRPADPGGQGEAEGAPEVPKFSAEQLAQVFDVPLAAIPSWRESHIKRLAAEQLDQLHAAGLITRDKWARSKLAGERSAKDADRKDD